MRRLPAVTVVVFGVPAAGAGGGEPPALLPGRAGGGYRPDDPAGAGPDPTVTFEDDRMTITGPAGAATARSSA